MIDTFDSRALRRTDCYAQRFMRAGAFPYHVLPVRGDCVVDERPYSVKVVERKSEMTMTQHDVVVHSEGSHFRVEPPTLTIEVGDLVLWNCPRAAGVPYVVVGEKEFFNSQRLVNESGYSHAFAATGEYEWVDAYGSEVGGLVRVKDPGCTANSDFKRWRKQLETGGLVTISGTTVEPREIEIVTGQTVFFVVTKGPGVSITDRRLAAKAHSKREAPASRRPASA